MSDLLDIKYYYKEGLEAQEEKDYEAAVDMFRACWELYNKSDSAFIHTVSEIANDALERHNSIVKRKRDKLDESGFDEIEYEV